MVTLGPRSVALSASGGAGHADAGPWPRRLKQTGKLIPPNPMHIRDKPSLTEVSPMVTPPQ